MSRRAVRACGPLELVALLGLAVAAGLLLGYLLGRFLPTVVILAIAGARLLVGR